ncbi:MAG: type II toxin-antitoxin system HipA family toxin [Devosia sp.]|nr:type II toxin-antitoxin system HipA family toxin [Devosia sp.]
MSRRLDVYLLDRLSGVLTQDDAGQLGFTYAADYLASSSARVISFAMPLTDKPYNDAVARPYFSGLLPDENARRRLASALGVSEGNPFGLLEVIGGECAGALSLYPQSQLPPSDDEGVELLTPDRLEEVLAELRTRPLLGGEEGVRMSLAGAQDKLAVCIEGDAVGLAKGGRPTTHILKPLMEALEGTVENEYFCMRLAAQLGFTVPDVCVRRDGKTPFLLVERYDRLRGADQAITRLHQEDFCQALSVPPELKYEEEGGPGTERSLGLIAAATARPAAARLSFVRMLAFHYLVGNADAHAKNFALLYTDPVPDLAPVYDVVCTAAYKRLAKKMAMSIGGRAVPDTIQLEHWLTLVPNTRGAQRLLTRDLADMATRITTEASSLLHELNDQGVTHPVLKDIRRIVGIRAAHVLRSIDKAGEAEA